MKASGCLFNALAVLFIALSLATCAWTGAIFVNPQGPFNPLRPPVLDTPVALPSATPERQATDALNFPTLPPEWTATFTPRPATATATHSPEPSATPVPSATVLASPVGPTATHSETPQPTRTPTRTVRPLPPSPTPGSYPATSVPPTPTSGGYP